MQFHMTSESTAFPTLYRRPFYEPNYFLKKINKTSLFNCTYIDQILLLRGLHHISVSGAIDGLQVVFKLGFILLQVTSQISKCTQFHCKICNPFSLQKKYLNCSAKQNIVNDLRAKIHFHLTKFPLCMLPKYHKCACVNQYKLTS